MATCGPSQVAESLSESGILVEKAHKFLKCVIPSLFLFPVKLTPYRDTAGYRSIPYRLLCSLSLFPIFILVLSLCFWSVSLW